MTMSNFIKNNIYFSLLLNLKLLYYPITFGVHKLWLCLHLNKALHDWIKWLRSTGHMFISQGPLGSLRAQKNMLSVFSDIYWIRTKLDFFPFFLISSLSLLERIPLHSACTRVCMPVLMHVRMLCMLTKYFNPVVMLQAPAHSTSVTVSTTSPQFSANKFHFCALKDRYFFLHVFCSSLSLSLLSCSHHFTSVSLQQPFVSRLKAFHHLPPMLVKL